MELMNSIILAIADPLMNWMLYLPRDVALFFVAIGTALILTVVRIWTTDQDILKRSKADKKVIKGLLKEAKQNRDKERIAQLKTTMNQIGIVSFKAEGKPLLASIIPIAIIAVWAMARLSHFAPAEGESLHVSFYGPAMQIGEVVHAEPQEGLKTETGWIQRVQEDYTDDKVTGGRTDWEFTAELRDEPYNLVVCYPGWIINRELIMDGKTYSPILAQYGKTPGEMMELKLKEYKPFGIVPGFPQFFLPAWLLGYLIIVIPLALIMKPVLRIQ